MADRSSEIGFPQSGPDDDRCTIAIFACVTAVALSTVHYAARLGFRENPVSEVVETLAISFVLILFPQGVRFALRMLGLPACRWWSVSDAGLSLVALFALPLASLAGSRFGVNVLPVVVCLGFVLFAVMVATWFARGSVGKNMLFLTGAGLFGLWVAFTVWGTGWHSPLFEEALAGGYYLCKDVLVTSSMTGMLRTYGVPSTGLDGVPYCWYHWGAYWFFALISEMERIRVIRFMQLGYPVIFLPFLLSRFLEFSVHCRELFAPDRQPRDLRQDGVFWLLFVLGWIGFIPLEVGQRIPLGPDVIFYSESYAIGSACSFLVLSLGIHLIRSATDRPVPSLTIGDHCLIGLFPLMFAGIGLIKISQMYLMVLAYGYLFLRLKAWRYRTPIMALVVSLVLLPVVVKFTSPGGAAGAYNYIYPLAFFVSLVPLAWKPFFFLLFYFWPWAYIITRLYWEGVATIGDMKDALFHGRLIPVETVIVLCIVGSAPAFILPIGGGSGLFFMAFQSWLALSLLLADRDRLRELAGRVCGIQEATLGWDKLQLRKVFALLVVVCLFGSAAANALHVTWRMVYQNVCIRNQLLHPEESEPSSSLKERWYSRVVKDSKALRFSALQQFVSEEVLPLVTTVQDRLEHARGYPVIAVFRELDAISPKEKRRSLIFMPRSNRVYWDLLPMCEAVPLIVPALTGMAMIDGLPDPDCRTYLGHFDMYKRKPGNIDHVDRSARTLCADVGSHGFHAVIVVDPDKDNRLIAERSDCP
jgi:hypothetical protein